MESPQRSATQRGLEMMAGISVPMGTGTALHKMSTTKKRLKEINPQAFIIL